MAGNDIILNVGANLSPAQRQLQGFVTQAQRQLGSQSFAFKLDEKGFRQPLGRITGDLNQFQGAMDASIARTLAFGASVGAIGGVTKAFKDMVAVTASVEHSLKEINVLLNLSTKDLQGFSKELFGVAKNTASSFATVTTAATEFSRQGLSAAETAKRVNNALILTRLSGLDAEASVSALTAAVNGFKSEAITTTEVVNRLANVDAKFAVSSADLAKALSRAGAVSTDAKVKFNELVAATTAVQQATARGGNVIGNGFKTIFTRLQRSKVRQELEKIGVATTTSTGSIRGAIDVLTDYAKVYQTLSDQQKAFTSEQVAGVFQINTLKALLGDLSNEFGIYNQALSTANATTNEAVQRNAQLNDTLVSMASQTGTEIAELAAKIGTISFEGNFKGLLGLLKGILGNVNQGLDSEGAGAQIAKGIMSGLGNFLSGPGLAVALVGITRLLGFIGSQTTKAIGQVLAIGSKAEKRQVVQQKINALLQEDNSLLKQIFASSGHIDDINKLVTKSIHDQNRALANQKLLVSEIARSFQVTKAGSIGPVGGGASGGFVPNLVRGERANISKGVGGARSGDRPVVIPNFNFGRGAKGTMVAHTGEHIVPNFAGGGSAIFNRNMASSMGLPAGAKRVGAAQGFVPNFANFKLRSGETVSGAKLGSMKSGMSPADYDFAKANEVGSAFAPAKEKVKKIEKTPGAFNAEKGVSTKRIIALVANNMGPKGGYQFPRGQTGKTAVRFTATGTHALSENGSKQVKTIVAPYVRDAADEIFSRMTTQQPQGGIKTIPDGLSKISGSVFEAAAQKVVNTTQFESGVNLDMSTITKEQKDLLGDVFNLEGLKENLSGADVKLGYNHGLMQDMAKKILKEKGRFTTLKGFPKTIPHGKMHFVGDSAGGYIPSFANLAAVSNTPAGKRALTTERALAGSSRMGFDSRVGYGVFNNSQGSLGNAVSQHLNAGDSMASLSSSGEAAQAAVAGGQSAAAVAAAMGFLPNFELKLKRGFGRGGTGGNLGSPSGASSADLRSKGASWWEPDGKKAGEELQDGVEKGAQRGGSILGRVMAATFTAEMVSAQVSGAIRGDDFESQQMRERISGTVSAATTFGTLGAQIHPVIGAIAGLGAGAIKLVGTFDEAANAVEKLRISSAHLVQQQDQGNAALANYITLVHQFQSETNPQQAQALLAQVGQALSEVQGPLRGEISERGMDLGSLRQLEVSRQTDQGGERRALSLETARALEAKVAAGNFWTKGVSELLTIDPQWQKSLDTGLRGIVDFWAQTFGGEGISGRERGQTEQVSEARNAVAVMIAAQSTFEGSVDELKKIGANVAKAQTLDRKGLVTVGQALEGLGIDSKDVPKELSESLNDDVAEASKGVQELLGQMAGSLKDRIIFERGEGRRIAQMNADIAATALKAKLDAMKIDPDKIFGRAVRRTEDEAKRGGATGKFLGQIEALQKKFIQTLPKDMVGDDTKKRATFNIEREAIERGKDLSLASSQVKFLKTIATELGKDQKDPEVVQSLRELRTGIEEGQDLEKLLTNDLIKAQVSVSGLLEEQVEQQKAIKKAALRQETLLKLNVLLQQAQKTEKARAATRGELGGGKLDLAKSAPEIRKNLGLISRGAGSRRPTDTRALQQEAGAFEGVLSKFGNVISEGLRTQLEGGGKKRRTFANLQEATQMLAPGFQQGGARFDGQQDYLRRLIPALERRLDPGAAKRLSPNERLNTKVLLDIARTSQQSFQKSPQATQFEKMSQRFRTAEAMAQPSITREIGVAGMEQQRTTLLAEAQHIGRVVESSQDLAVSSPTRVARDKDLVNLSATVKKFMFKGDEEGGAAFVKGKSSSDLRWALTQFQKSRLKGASTIGADIKLMQEEVETRRGNTDAITSLKDKIEKILQDGIKVAFKEGGGILPEPEWVPPPPTDTLDKGFNDLLKYMKQAEKGKLNSKEAWKGRDQPTGGAAGGSLGGAFINERRDIANGVGGAIPGMDKPVLIPNFNGGAVVAHTGEYLVNNYSGGKSAIFNRSMVSSMGMPAGARAINAAGGVVPMSEKEYMKKRVERLRGRYEKHSQDDSAVESDYTKRMWKVAVRRHWEMGLITESQYKELYSKPPNKGDVQVITSKAMPQGAQAMYSGKTVFIKGASVAAASPKNKGSEGYEAAQKDLEASFLNEFSHVISDRTGNKGTSDKTVVARRLKAIQKAFNEKLTPKQKERFLRWHGDPNKGLVHPDTFYGKRRGGLIEGRAAEEMVSTIVMETGVNRAGVMGGRYPSVGSVGKTKGKEARSPLKIGGVELTPEQEREYWATRNKKALATGPKTVKINLDHLSPEDQAAMAGVGTRGTMPVSPKGPKTVKINLDHLSPKDQAVIAGIGTRGTMPVPPKERWGPSPGREMIFGEGGKPIGSRPAGSLEGREEILGPDGKLIGYRRGGGKKSTNQAFKDAFKKRAQEEGTGDISQWKSKTVKMTGGGGGSGPKTVKINLDHLSPEDQAAMAGIGTRGTVPVGGDGSKTVKINLDHLSPADQAVMAAVGEHGVTIGGLSSTVGGQRRKKPTVASIQASDYTRQEGVRGQRLLSRQEKLARMRAREASLGGGIRRSGSRSRSSFGAAGSRSRSRFGSAGSRSRSRFGGAAEGFIPNFSMGEGLGTYGSVANQFLNFAEGGGAGAGGVAGAGGGGEMAASMGGEGGALMAAGERGITQAKASQQKHNVNVNIEVYGNVSEGAVDGIQSNSSDMATVLEGLVNG
jgi:TP901 family phage tail tape measure protein